MIYPSRNALKDTKQNERKGERSRERKRDIRPGCGSLRAGPLTSGTGGLGVGAGASTFKLITVKVNCPKQCNIPFKGPWEFGGA